MEIDLPAVEAPPRPTRMPPHAASAKAANPSQVFAVMGVAGAALLFAGDQLLYGHWGDGVSFERTLSQVAANASLARLFAGGALGPIGALLVAAGFWHVHLQIRPVWPRGSWVLFAGFAAMMAGAAAFHAVWTDHMLVLRFDTDGTLNSLGTALGSYMAVLFVITALPGVIASGVLLAAVLTGRTRYPRWAAPINPAVLALLSGVTIWAPAPWGAAVRGGSLSLMLLAFFVASAVLTRPRHRASWIEDEVPGASL